MQSTVQDGTIKMEKLDRKKTIHLTGSFRRDLVTYAVTHLQPCSWNRGGGMP